MNKICTKCNIEKSASRNYFYIDKTKKDGLTTTCIDCRKIYHKNRYQSNKEIFKEKGHLEEEAEEFRNESIP